MVDWVEARGRMRRPGGVDPSYALSWEGRHGTVFSEFPDLHWSPPSYGHKDTVPLSYEGTSIKL